MPPRTALRAGDRVAVPWGVDTRQGEVRAVYHTGDVERVLVELDESASDLEESQTIVLPAEVVKPLAEEPDLPPAGAWLLGFRYEREVAEALSRVLADSEPRLSLNAEHSGKEIDLLVETSRGIIVVEIKAGRGLAGRILDDAIAQLSRTSRIFPSAKGLLVTPSALPPSIATRVRPNGLLTPNIGAVQWRSSKDDKRLQRVAQALLNDSADNLRAAEA